MLEYFFDHEKESLKVRVAELENYLRHISTATIDSVPDALAGHMGEYKRGWYSAMIDVRNRSLDVLEHGYKGYPLVEKPDNVLPDIKTS